MSSSSVHSTGAPAPVRRAFVLWMAVLVLNVVAVLLGLFLTPADVQGVDPGTAGGVRIGAAAFVLVVLALVGLFAVTMRGGRNWARIALIVPTVLGVAATPRVLSPSGAIDVVTTVLTVVGVVLSLVAVVLSFTGHANRFFRAET